MERTFLMSFFERFDDDESFLGSIYGRVVSGSKVKYIYLGLSNKKMYIAESTDDSKDHIIREKTYFEISHDINFEEKDNEYIVHGFPEFNETMYLPYSKGGKTFFENFKKYIDEGSRFGFVTDYIPINRKHYLRDLDHERLLKKRNRKKAVERSKEQEALVRMMWNDLDGNARLIVFLVFAILGIICIISTILSGEFHIFI